MPIEPPFPSSNLSPRQAPHYFYYEMSPADNFGLFINILSLIDVFLRLLIWFLPCTQVQELVKMLQTAKTSAERAADVGLDIGDIRGELQRSALATPSYNCPQI